MQTLPPKVFALAIPIFLVTVVAFAPGSARKSTITTGAKADSVAVAKVVNEFHDALSKGDSAAALRLLSPNAIILESGGVESRSEYRSHHLPADIEFSKAIAEKRGQLNVSVRGPVAWTARTSESKGEFKGRTIDSFGAESMVLTKDNEGWRIQSIHWSSRRRAG